jgi:hypothetical protein
MSAGSAVLDLLHGAPCPVHVVPGRDTPPEPA